MSFVQVVRRGIFNANPKCKIVLLDFSIKRKVETLFYKTD